MERAPKMELLREEHHGPEWDPNSALESCSQSKRVGACSSKELPVTQETLLPFEQPYLPV
jgi:hypothetical protein